MDQVTVEYIDDSTMNGTAYRLVSMIVSKGTEMYMFHMYKAEGPDNKPTLNMTAHKMAKRDRITASLPIADLPRWVKQVIRKYYHVMRVGVS